MHEYGSYYLKDPAYYMYVSNDKVLIRILLVLGLFSVAQSMVGGRRFRMYIHYVQSRLILIFIDSFVRTHSGCHFGLIQIARIINMEGMIFKHLTC